MKRFFLLAGIFLLLVNTGCRHSKEVRDNDIFCKENLVAWCIVPFDAADRTPEERALMLKDLGISQLAYDYRDEHLPFFRDEIRVLREQDIRLRAVWLWIEDNDSALFSKSNEEVLKTLAAEQASTEVWLSFPESYFAGLSEDSCFVKAERAIKQVIRNAEASGSTVALYNHGGWFGEPENQIRIIEHIGDPNLKMVYNFHHAHEQTDRFAQVLEQMLPYLSAININGMIKEGPKIIPVGKGDLEAGMLEQVYLSGFRGSIGILGHTDGRDIAPVLRENMEGLDELAKKIRDKN